MDIMKVTELENLPGLALFVDFRKGFDTVDWNFLFKTLEAFNFGPLIQKWIRTFYTDCSSCFMNNGDASEFFNLERGVRQGCPLSGTFFVLCAEILGNVIRNDKNITGINIHHKEFKLSINKSKREGMWLGSSRLNTITPLGIAWPANSILALGINFSQKFRAKADFREKLTESMVSKKSYTLWPNNYFKIFGDLQTCL